MSEYPALGKERRLASIVINKFILQGYGIIINTCREGIALADAIEWMKKHHIHYHYVNCNFPHLIRKFSADCRKISADVYIDDKNLGVLPSWGDIYKQVERQFNIKS